MTASRTVFTDRSSSEPLYAQIARQLEAAIIDGQLAKGSFLGNEIELADEWNVSRPTVRQAMQELVSAGLLVRRRGVGTQVVSDQIRRPAGMSSLHDALADQGRQPSTVVLLRDTVAADAGTAADLEIPAGAPVIRLERCRCADGRPLAIMRNWLPEDIGAALGADDLAAHGLYALLRRNGVRPHSATQRVGAVVASAADAAILDLAPRSALLAVRRVVRNESGRPIELADHVYDASRYTIEMNVLEP